MRNGRYADAGALLMRFGAACDGVGARASQCKAYLGAVVAWLSAGDAAGAWRAFQDAMGVEAFSGSDEAFAADALFEAYAGGKAEAVRALAQAKPAFKNLDTALGRLALRLPAGGDVDAMAVQIRDLMGGGDGAGGGGGGGGESDEELM